jgi:hypothetical protein
VFDRPIVARVQTMLGSKEREMKSECCCKGECPHVITLYSGQCDQRGLGRQRFYRLETLPSKHLIAGPAALPPDMEDLTQSNSL